MPTVIMIDVSLSMARPVVGEDGDVYTRLQLAIHSINVLLDYLSQHSKLEFVAVLSYSSRYNIISSFTRDYDLIKSKICELEEQDKTLYEPVLHAINRLVLAEWGTCMPCQVIMLTDGGASFTTHDNIPLAFSFPGQLTIISVSDSRENISVEGSLTKGAAHLVRPEGALTHSSIGEAVRNMASATYKPFLATLKCGHLSSDVCLVPSPMCHTRSTGFELVTHFLSDTLQICGFVENDAVGSPAILSKHLVLATPPSNIEDSPTTADFTKKPSFCVMLHAALKVENMVALCELSTDWFGILYSWIDSKKKCNLMLTVLEPGRKPLPWFGDFRHLGPIPFNLPAGAEFKFPVVSSERKSYNQTMVVWIKDNGLQADIQKILRQARKLPDKSSTFYKELNRLRRAAISFGFNSLLEGLADILERECTLLPGQAHPDCAMQLTHVAVILRSALALDPKYTIPPMITQFSGHHA